jgi:hypothetical protein
MSVGLIIGGAECVWDDAKAALALFDPDAFFAVKDQMYLWPLRVDYGVTLHPERTAGYLKRRKEKGLNNNFPVYAHRASPNTTHTTSDWQGSSGLFAIKVSRIENISAVVLVGVPMTASAGHITRKKEWVPASQYRRGWLKHQSEIADTVRSMSGWTREIFGAPDKDWLEQFHAAPANEVLLQRLLASIAR